MRFGFIFKANRMVGKMWAVSLESLQVCDFLLFLSSSSVIAGLLLFFFFCSSRRSPSRVLPCNVKEKETSLLQTNPNRKEKKGKSKKIYRSNIRRRRKIISLFHDDLLIEILSRLPVKSLMRFKCVCKSWHTLITNPSFISKHLFNYNSFGQLVVGPMYYSKDPVLSLISFDNSNNTNKLDASAVISVDKFDFSSLLNRELNGCIHMLFGSCRGIVCLYGSPPDNIALWNPAIRELKILPVSGIPRPPHTRKYIKASVGLGFDSRTNDFKVVQIVRCKSYGAYSKGCQVEIYSLNTNSWRKLDISVPAKIRYQSWSSVCTNNRIICWWATLKDVGGVILSFDVSDEVFLITPVPSYYGAFVGKDRFTRAIVPFDDSIALIVYTPQDEPQSFEMWVMNEFGVEQSWTRLLSFGPFPEIYQPLGFWKNGQFLLTNHSGKLFLYEHGTQEIKYLGIQTKFNISYVLGYKESLVSVNGGRNVLKKQTME